VVENRLTPAGRRLKRRALRVPLALLRDVGMSLKEVAELRCTVDAFVGKLQRMHNR
jgi:hypothetical protein